MSTRRKSPVLHKKGSMKEAVEVNVDEIKKKQPKHRVKESKKWKAYNVEKSQPEAGRCIQCGRFLEIVAIERISPSTGNSKRFCRMCGMDMLEKEQPSPEVKRALSFLKNVEGRRHIG